MNSMKITIKSSTISVQNKNFVRVLFSKTDETEIVREGKQKHLSIGIGKKLINRRAFIIVLRKIIGAAKRHKIKYITLNISDLPTPKEISPFELGLLIAENFEMANFELTNFKTKPKEGWNEVQEAAFYGKRAADFNKGIAHGKIIGEEINKSRILSNTPGGDMTPRLLAEEVRRAARGTGVIVRVLGKKEMARLKMGAVLGVARGSDEEPKFIILEYLDHMMTRRNESRHATFVHAQDGMMQTHFERLDKTHRIRPPNTTMSNHLEPTTRLRMIADGAVVIAEIIRMHEFIIMHGRHHGDFMTAQNPQNGR